MMTKEERSAFCSADKGNPYPPCWNPNHKCEDCKREYEQRIEHRKRLKDMLDRRLEQNPTETYFS